MAKLFNNQSDKMHVWERFYVGHLFGLTNVQLLLRNQADKLEKLYRALLEKISMKTFLLHA